MPNWFKLILASFAMIFGFILMSLYIPFIYADKDFLSLVIGYVLLAIWFSSYVVYGHNLDKSVVEKQRKNKLYVYIIFCFSPLFVGSMLSPSCKSS